MHAWVLNGINDLRFEEREKPVPGEGRVLLKVAACGICGSDIPRIYDTGAHRHPLIPGHEFAGTVVQTGTGCDVSLTGVRAGVFPLIPCGTCPQCLKKRYEMCDNYNYTGSRCDGGFAEYVCVPESSLIRLPDNVSFEQAAMLEPMAVAVHAMRAIAPLPGEKVAICGLGTIGLLLLMFLLEAGIRDIYLIGNKELQKQTALSLGIDAGHYCDSKKTDALSALKEMTASEGCDVFFECTGRNETVNLALNATAKGGRIMLIGNPHSDMLMERNDYWQILRRQLTLRGSWNSSFTGSTSDDWHYVLQKLEQGRIAPEKLISHRLPLAELEKGLRIMRDRSEEYCKIMITEV